MPRPLRDFRPGRTYLISQQGNKQISVYLDNEDRATATRLLQLCAMRYNVELLAFGFGEYEGRWMLQPSSRSGISNLMRDMQSAYSRYLNAKYNHHPCCARRRRFSGTNSCHISRLEPIRNSSNWTPRFKATEIAEECREMAIRLVEGVRAEQSPSPPGHRKHKKPRLSPDLIVLREALRRSLPLAIVRRL